VSVDNPKGVLLPNQYVRVRLKGAIRPNAILVPQRAIQQSSKGHFVWVVKEGKAEARPVTVGNWEGDEWFVFEGLKAGEQAVVDGGLLLSPGVPLSVKPFTKSAGAPAQVAEPKKEPAGTGGKKH